MDVYEYAYAVQDPEGDEPSVYVTVLESSQKTAKSLAYWLLGKEYEHFELRLVSIEPQRKH